MSIKATLRSNDPRVLTAGQPLRYVTGLEDLYTVLAWLAAHTTYEHLGVTPGGVHPPKADRTRALDTMSFGRGTVHRQLLSPDSRSRPLVADYIDWSISQGARVRVSTHLERQFVVADSIAALVDVGDEQTVQGCLIVDPRLVAYWVMLFEQLWEQATPVAAEVARPVPLSVRQRQILRLLSNGLTDVELATTLGVTERTVRSDIATMRAVLGVRTRFQLGAAYAKTLTSTGRGEPR